MAEYVSFHRWLVAGELRGLPRASRFVFMELALAARATRGRIRLARSLGDVGALHDMIGGDRAEVEAAVAELVDARLIRIDEVDGSRELTFTPEWTEWNRIDATAAQRNRDARARQKAKKEAERQRDGSVTRNDTEHADAALRDKGKEIKGHERSPSGITLARVTLGSASGERIAEVYEGAVRERVADYTLAPSRRSALVELTNSTYAPADIAEKIAWLEKATREWIAAEGNDPIAHQGFAPHRMRVWLDAGKPTTRGSRASAPKQGADAALLAELERGGHS